MWLRHVTGFPRLACASDEFPASLELRTCRLATCVISRLRRASILGLRRKKEFQLRPDIAPVARLPA
jgi:hypothetical protein